MGSVLDSKACRDFGRGLLARSKFASDERASRKEVEALFGAHSFALRSVEEAGEATAKALVAVARDAATARAETAKWAELCALLVARVEALEADRG